MLARWKEGLPLEEHHPARLPAPCGSVASAPGGDSRSQRPVAAREDRRRRPRGVVRGAAVAAKPPGREGCRGSCSRSARTGATPCGRRLPATCTTAWRSWASRWRSISASAIAARRLRRARHLPQRQQPRPDGTPGALVPRPPRAWLGEAGVARRHRQRGLRRRDGRPLAGPASARGDELLVPLHATVAARAPLPRAPRSGPVREGRALPRRAVSVAGHRATHRGDPARARRHARADGLRGPRADPEGLGGRSRRPGARCG